MFCARFGSFWLRYQSNAATTSKISCGNQISTPSGASAPDLLGLLGRLGTGGQHQGHTISITGALWRWELDGRRAKRCVLRQS